MNTKLFTNYLFVFTFLFLYCATTVAKGKDRVYVFGVSESFKDSTIYLTDIQMVEGAQIQPRTKFFLGRAEYSRQLKEFLTREMGKPDRICAIYFSKSKRKIENKYIKVRRRYTQKRGLTTEQLPTSRFQFRWVGSVLDNNQAAQSNSVQTVP